MKSSLYWPILYSVQIQQYALMPYLITSSRTIKPKRTSIIFFFCCLYFFLGFLFKCLKLGTIHVSLWLSRSCCWWNKLSFVKTIFRLLTFVLQVTTVTKVPWWQMSFYQDQHTQKRMPLMSTQRVVLSWPAKLLPHLAWPAMIGRSSVLYQR